MARAVHSEFRTERVSFELDRFQTAAGGRLEVTGRWFGVRGRRFVRPTLTLFTDEGAFRALADLEHKPWAPEEGGRWDAAFPWEGGADVLEAELDVAPDVTVTLPTPGSSRKTRRAPRDRPSEAGSNRSASSAPPSVRRDELARLRDELAASRREADRLRHQIDELREQAGSARAARSDDTSAREAALADLQHANAALEAATAARDQALRERDAALADRQRALAAREQALGEREYERQWREQVMSDQDAAQRASSDTIARLDQAQIALEHALGERDQVQHALDRAMRERDDAISSRGAALVMGNAARARIGPEHHAGWLQRTAAVVVLVCVVFALLIVLHLL